MTEETKRAVQKHFDAYASKWSSRLRQHNYQTRLKVVKDLCPSTTDRVVDLGCGTGDYSRLFDGSTEYLGLDNSEEMIRFAQSLYPTRRFQVVDVEDTKIPRQSFDLGFAIGLFEYLESPESVAKELVSLIREGGHIICSFPNSAEKTPLKIPGLYPVTQSLERLLKKAGVISKSRDAKYVPEGYSKPTLVNHRKFSRLAVIEIFAHYNVAFEETRHCNFRLFRYILGNDLLSAADKVVSAAITCCRFDNFFSPYASNIIIRIRRA